MQQKTDKNYEMKMINKDHNLLNFSTKERNTYRSEQRKHQVSAIAVAKNKLSDNTAFWKNVEN